MEPPKIGDGVSGFSVGCVQAFFSAAGAAGAAPSLARTTRRALRLTAGRADLRVLLLLAVAARARDELRSDIPIAAAGWRAVGGGGGALKGSNEYERLKGYHRGRAHIA